MDINKKANKSKWIVVFDLDDTLYKETDYNLSGVISVANDLEKLFNKNIQNDLIKILATGKISVPLKISAHKFSAAAKLAIEKSGGEAIIL